MTHSLTTANMLNMSKEKGGWPGQRKEGERRIRDALEHVDEEALRRSDWKTIENLPPTDPNYQRALRRRQRKDAPHLPKQK